MTLSAETAPPGRGYIDGPGFDAVFLIGAPVVALLLGFLFSLMPRESDQIFFIDQPTTMSSLVLKTIIHAHLVIVFFRSHGNPNVKKRHPVRFFVVPVLLVSAMFVSLEVLAVVLIVTTYWDMVHSSLQTFGIGRIYDMKAGADVHKGRQLDLWLNHLIYLGPFVVGPIWVGVLQVFTLAQQTHVPGAAEVAAALRDVQPLFSRFVLVAAPIFVAVYVWQLARRLRARERLSWQKHVLFATTAVASVWAWGFNSFGQALLVVNAFHAVQYFAIVWWSEREHMGRLFGTAALPYGRALTGIAFLIVGLAYGFWLGSVSDFWATDVWVKRGVLALTNTVAVLHFWYDGFIWSVRKGAV